MNELYKALKKVEGICPGIEILSQEPWIWMELGDFSPSTDGVVTITRNGNIIYEAYDVVTDNNPEGIACVNVGL